MALLQHVYPRGRTFWWRRIHPLFDGRKLDIRLPLGTSTRLEARDRGAALTAMRGRVMAILHDRLRAPDSRPTEAELQAIAKRAYGERLAQFNDDLRLYPHEAPTISAANRAYADFYQRLTENGDHIGLLPDERRALRMRGWDQVRIDRLCAIISDAEAGRQPIKDRFVDAMLQDAGFEPQPALRKLLKRALYPAYRDACLDAERTLQRHGQFEAGDNVEPNDIRLLSTQPSATMTRVVESSPEAMIPIEWRALTATTVAERFIEMSPAMFEHRQTGKRAKAQVSEQTLRQIRWAATLLERSMQGRPFWSLTFDDLVALDKWFDRLPVTTSKAPWHRCADTALQAICDDAVERVEAGEYEADAIGLGATTTNKHFRKLAKVHAFLREQVPAIAELKFTAFMQADVKDERIARAAYTVEQGRELFALPPWTGCAAVNDRLSPGIKIYHDSLYFVLLLVWYTGMRREEVCKLLVTDIGWLDDIMYISIDNTEAGRVKNASSKRLIAVCNELRRLGFAQYYDAIRAARYAALFPELVSERAQAKKGDVFYKLWWIYVAPCISSLQRGQAMHAARHMVSTELKELEVFSEHRNDALGHAGSGEGERRYSKATRLKRLLDLANKIPNVTHSLPTNSDINLLPSERLAPRPTRGPDKGVQD